MSKNVILRDNVNGNNPTFKKTGATQTNVNNIIHLLDQTKMLHFIIFLSQNIKVPSPEFLKRIKKIFP